MDLKRKPAFKDLNIKLNHLYTINKEYERAVKNTFNFAKEQIEDTLRGENFEEQKDLNRILEQLERQREALLKSYVYELRRLYRYLETVEDREMKLILTLRHAHFLTWEQIADCMGNGLRAGDIKILHDSFIIEVIKDAKKTTKTMQISTVSQSN